MGNLPLYESHNLPDIARSKKVPNQANVGLWWNKYFYYYQHDFKKIASEDSKKEWIKTVEGQRGQKQVIERFARRQYDLGTAQNARQKFFKTNWNFATGLGYSHPVENGFCWHHTLGVPYLPASSIKGLLRAWIERWEEFADDDKRNNVLKSWFGNEPKEDTHDKLQAGSLIFFDAIPVSLPTLSADVMTPHMGNWYAEGGKIKNADGSGDDASRIPGDWHSPVPVPFLVVENGSFLFQIAARPKSTFGDDYDLDKAMELLQLALEYLGAGAKTAAGYGRMIEDTEIYDRWEKRREQEAKRRAKQAEREAKEKARAAIKETEEIVEMIAEPGMQNMSVMVRTKAKEELECTGLPAFANFETPLGRWAGDEDAHKLTAKVTRKNGDITKVLFVKWYG